jgi:outer membrane protein OmpA-like peptidoglycan-associated protein
MKRLLLASVAVAALAPSVTAFAQDWWSGPEIGLQGGYAFDGSSGNLTCPGFDGGEGGVTCATERIIDPKFHYHFDTTGALGGAHAGYNWQWGHTVLGLEADAEFADVTGSTAPPGEGFSVRTKMDFDASVRGKLGWAFDRILIYGTGGVAFGDVDTSYRVAAVSGGPLLAAGGTSSVRVGWTGGGGMEYAFTRNWEAGLEYRYTDLGNKSFVNTALGVSDSNEYNFSAVRLSLTYRFAPPPPPMPPVVVPAAAPAPAPPMARTFLVFFDFDKYNLTADARRVIDAAAASYKATGSARIDVSGYTDLAGTQAYNLRLSQRRADAVATYLEKQGVPKNVMDVKWFGKEHPRVPTPDGVREPQNRRVEIVMP